MRVIFQVKKYLWVLLLSGFGLNAVQSSAQASSGTISPYTKLYENRWAQTKLDIDVARIKLDYNTRLLNRFRPLLGSSIISKQKFEEQSIQVELAKLEVENMRAKASEAQSLYEVNKLRIDNGLEVAICPEGE